MTMLKHCPTAIIFIAIIAIIAAAENYVDYGEDIADKAPERIHELYNILLQRNALDNAGLADIPIEHLMIRKSQRSPSLRLRFGRSGPLVSAGIFPRSGIEAATLEED